MVSACQKVYPCDRILTQRIFKSTVNTAVAFIFILIPKVREHLGTEPAMLPLISVMVHPGRRVSGTIQGAIYCITGLIFGLAYSIFGRFLAQQCIGPSWRTVSEVNQVLYNYKRFEAGLAILAMFETFMLFFHGWMRSMSHHYFGIVFPLFLVVHFTFLAPLTSTPGIIAKSFSTPFYMGIAMSLFWNIVLFPEFGSTYLGNATVGALNEIHKDLNDAVKFFISLDNTAPQLYKTPPVTLPKLLKYKTAITKQVANCDLVLQECIYEISYSYVSPYSVTDILKVYKDMSIFINGIVNACQLQFILLGRTDTYSSEDVEFYSKKEISFANADKLLYVLDHIRLPIFNLHRQMSKCLYEVSALIAYSYDVDLKKVYHDPDLSEDFCPRLLDKNSLQALDLNASVARLQELLEEFDSFFKQELLDSSRDLLTPNDEMFLLSSFLMNFKEVTNEAVRLNSTIKDIFQYRLDREKKGWMRGKKLWFTFLKNFQSLKRWYVGNATNVTENDSLKGVLHMEGVTELVARRPTYAENELLMQKTTTQRTSISTNQSLLPTSNVEQVTRRKFINIRTSVLDFMIWCDNFYKRSRDHFRFGFQVALALMLASFPMFVPSIRHWYIDYRGAWIGFVCILCLEPSVGGTFWVFFLRAVGVVTGAVWGLVSYYAGTHQKDPYLEVVITLFGAVPGFYFLLGTPYVKAAIIQIISIYIVMAAAIIPSSVPGGIVVNFAKRCLAVAYGGGAALLVQVFVFPIKARDQLNEEVAFVCGCISELELIYATNLEGEPFQLSMGDKKYERMVKISNSAKAALSRAEAFNKLTRQEPRLRGSFTELEKIFTQIIFIQRQIVERMDTVALIRKQYGSAVIEELNSTVYPYRRQMVGNFTSLMRALQEAFTTRSPLPQFLPSTRVSHRRLINKVRQILEVRTKVGVPRREKIIKDLSPLDVETEDEEEEEALSFSNLKGTKMTRSSSNGETLPNEQDFLLKEKYLSWNASSAAMEEIIEYMEELLYLTKLVVGVNEFKYGFLSRPLYEDWAAEAIRGFDEFIKGKLASTESTSSGSNSSNQQDAASAPPSVSPQQPSLLSGTEEESIRSGISSTIEEKPVPLNAGNLNKEDGNFISRRQSLNLARIASSRKGEQLPKNFRDRTYSIGGRTGLEFSKTNPLNRTKTLGDADSEYAESGDTSDSDEELPLALRRVVNRMTKKGN
ncbi:uncharacterized protein KNAG_0C00530 [Huiozyma naganishii CBS 8797]|uniref:ER transporter 6TM N-terminal domain-containing protein n=1 Tax=Huiozyma naganishii (strain ATCC MYA-139 / BCRC 22969 / CBS 8797 / KCTC 17520 / NBRC 10181 / NCYC 3082 / Yp74L-3) TaxID=1071383 RepID=J7RW20_HUIN7|nr:hypothetical protein KNAG_0C00530 [Kazachstania naganishii CBS 8797]CCK69167.1 hypothetical protein KNAG_0C00530 [Kazachstania naganishii CBS 8797]